MCWKVFVAATYHAVCHKTIPHRNVEWKASILAPVTYSYYLKSEWLHPSDAPSHMTLATTTFTTFVRTSLMYTATRPVCVTRKEVG